jgi:hypothetical protein
MTKQETKDWVNSGGLHLDASQVQKSVQTEPGNCNEESSSKGHQKRATVIGSKVNVKVNKSDVTVAQGIHGIAFEVSKGGG